MADDFQRLDGVLSQLALLLDAPGPVADGSAESLWQKMDVFYKSMGADALRAMLGRQGMSSNTVDDALHVLAGRRESQAGAAGR